jgi:hypothetical protein
MSKFLLTVCAFGLLFSSALAQEKSLEELDRESTRIWGAEGLQRLQFARTVPSGTNQRIEFLTTLNPDCTSSGDINVRVIKQPEHGKLESTPIVRKYFIAYFFRTLAEGLLRDGHPARSSAPKEISPARNGLGTACVYHRHRPRDL